MDVVVLFVYVHRSEMLKIWIVSIKPVSFSVFYCDFSCHISNLNATVTRNRVIRYKKHQLILLNWFVVIITSDSAWLMAVRIIWGCWVKHWHDNVIDDNKTLFKNSRNPRAWPNHSVTNDKKTSSKPTIILFISISTLKKIKNKRVQKLRFCLCNTEKTNQLTNHT